MEKKSRYKNSYYRRLKCREKAGNITQDRENEAEISASFFVLKNCCANAVILLKSIGLCLLNIKGINDIIK